MYFMDDVLEFVNFIEVIGNNEQILRRYVHDVDNPLEKYNDLQLYNLYR